jgi:hypothetical protein
LIAKDPTKILYDSQVDILRDTMDDGTVDATRKGFRDYCMGVITLMMNTPEFKSTYLALIDDMMSYDIKERLIFARELLYAFAGKYEVPAFVLYDMMGQTLDISVSSEEDIDDILEFIEFVEFKCVDTLVEVLFPFREKTKMLEAEQIIEAGGIELLKNFVDFIKSNSDKLPKLFVILVPLLSAQTLQTLILKMASHNWDEVFIEIKKKEVLSR